MSSKSKVKVVFTALPNEAEAGMEFGPVSFDVVTEEGEPLRGPMKLEYEIEAERIDILESNLMHDVYLAGSIKTYGSEDTQLIWDIPENSTNVSIQLPPLVIHSIGTFRIHVRVENDSIEGTGVSKPIEVVVPSDAELVVLDEYQSESN